MKKYVKPALDVIKLNAQPLLSASDPQVSRDEYGGGTVLSRRGFFDDEEDSEE